MSTNIPKIESDKCREAQGFEAVEAVSTLAQAFSNDPLLGWLLDEEDKVKQSLLMTNDFSSWIQVQKNCRIIVPKEGPTHSVAVWLPPSATGCQSISNPYRIKSILLYGGLIGVFYGTLALCLTTWKDFFIVAGASAVFNIISFAYFGFTKTLLSLSQYFGGEGETPNTVFWLDYMKNKKGMMDRGEEVEKIGKEDPQIPYWYLYTLGTRPEARGKGFASSVIKAVTDECDRTRIGAYLQNSNPNNTRLYEKHGFKAGKTLMLGGIVPVTCMWREPQNLLEKQKVDSQLEGGAIKNENADISDNFIAQPDASKLLLKSE